MNADDIGLQFDSTPVVRGVARAEKSLDELLKMLGKLESGLERFKNENTELSGSLRYIRQFADGAIKAFNDIQRNALEKVQAGNLKTLDLVREQNTAIQRLYEARLATNAQLTNDELEQWKKLGVDIGNVQKAQIREHNEMLKKKAAQEEAYMAEQRRRVREALAEQKRMADEGAKLYSQLNKKGSIAYSYIQDTETALAALRNFYTQQERIINNFGRIAGMSGPLASIRVGTASDSQAILSSMTAFYAQQERIHNNFGKQLAQVDSPLSSIRRKTEEDSAAILSGMRKFYADRERIMRNIEATRATSGVSTGVRMSSEAVSQAALGEMRNYYLGIGGKSSYGNSSWEAPAASMKEVNKELTKLRSSTGASGGVFKALGDDMGYAHSAARGLASGFNLLWLTWGKLVPLMAGASISFGLRKVFDVGSEVEYNIKFLQLMARTSKESAAIIRQELQNINAESIFTLTELSQAMVALGQAGRSPAQALQMLKPISDLATAGMVDLKTAYELVIQTQNLYGLQTADTGKLVSQLVKITQAGSLNVENLASSFKMASVAGVRFGHSVEEALAFFGALASAGIKDSMAGTAYINFLNDIAGRSSVARKAMEELRKVTGDTLRIWNDDKSMRDAVDITEELGAAFRKLDPETFNRILQGLTSERGIRTFFSAIREGSGNLRETISELQKVDKELAARQAQGLMDTTRGALKQFQSNLSNTLDQIFILHEDKFKQFFQSLVVGVTSPEFKSALNSVVSGFIALAEWVDRNSTVLLNLAKVFLAFKAAALAGNVLASLASGFGTLARSALNAADVVTGFAASSRIAGTVVSATGVSAYQAGARMLGFGGHTIKASVAMQALAASSRLGALAVAGLTTAVRVAGTVLGFLSGPIGQVLTLVATLWGTWKLMSSDGIKGTEDLSAAIVEKGRLNVAALKEEIQKLRERKALLNLSDEGQLFNSKRKELQEGIRKDESELANLQSQIAKTAAGSLDTSSKNAISAMKARADTLRSKINLAHGDIQKLNLEERDHNAQVAADEAKRRELDAKRIKDSLTEVGTVGINVPAGNPGDQAQVESAYKRHLNALQGMIDKTRELTQLEQTRNYIENNKITDPNQVAELEAKAKLIDSTKEEIELEQVRAQIRAMSDAATAEGVKKYQDSAASLAASNEQLRQEILLYGLEGKQRSDALAVIEAEVIARKELELVNLRSIPGYEAIADALAFEIQLLKEKQGLTAEMARLQNEPNLAAERFKNFGQVMEDSFGRAADALLEFVETGKFNYKSLINSMIADLLRYELKMQAMELWKNFRSPIMNGLATFGANLMGGNPLDNLMSLTGAFGTAHNGGIAGMSYTGSKTVPLSVFDGASRYHSGGLVGHEVPIIANRGEGVFTQGQMRNLAPVGSGEVNVQIINNGTEKVQVQESTVDSRGNRNIKVVIGDMVASEMRRPGSQTNTSTRNAFGLSPALVGR